MIEDAATDTVALLRDLAGRVMPRREAAEVVSKEDRNYAEIVQSLAGGTKVCLITSFPRSGNTWVRYLLSDIFLQRTGVATTTVLPIHPDKIIPDIYAHVAAEREAGITPGLFIKTHEKFDRLKKHLPAAALRQCKHVYIFRSPEDSLVSFCHLHLRDEKLKHKVRDGMDGFCRARAKDWAAHAASYVRAAQNGANVFFVSYENLLEQTGPVLGRMIDWLGLDCQEGMVQRAVLNMEFGQLRAHESNRSASPGEFSGRGGPGGGAAELEAVTVAGIRKEAAGVMQQVSELLSRQNGKAARCGG